MGIGASAGGLEALTDLLHHLPSDTGLALVLVQHLDPTRPSLMTELLGRRTSMSVLEGADRMAVKPGRVYVMPPGVDMTIGGGVLSVRPRRGPRVAYHPVDRFFESLAEDLGERAIGVVLSGAASDGAVGLSAIKAHGGVTFAQDEGTAKFQSMPRAAVAAGSVDFVLPPAGIARELVRLCRHPYLVAPAPPEAEEGGDDHSGLERVLTVLRRSRGVDFRGYRSTTMRRRVMRRMMLTHVAKLSDYAHLLLQRPSESATLFDDLLIGTTGFFRHHDDVVLTEKVFPTVTRNRAARAPVRIWVPGCASGEEVYTIAMCLREYLRARSLDVPVQIFGTDLKEAAIEQARAGLYPEATLARVPPRFVERYFERRSEDPSVFQIGRSIRDLCVFARHDVIGDPPFSRLDLISCQNVLIYFSPALQAQVLPRLHYALRPSGLLRLGPSESTLAAAELFTALDEKLSLYLKKGHASVAPPWRGDPAGAAALDAPREGLPPVERRVQRMVDRILAREKYACGVVVDGDLQALRFHGQTRNYLESAAGRASLNVLALLRGGLQFTVRAAVAQAERDRLPVTRERIWFESDGEERFVSLKVVPLPVTNQAGPRHVLLFGEIPGARLRRVQGSQSRLSPARQLSLMKQELSAAREYLRATIEDQAAAAEVLRSANEELLSGNEELQSLNEELETAKEELQSTNEELTTLNEELRLRNEELSETSTDLVSLLTSVKLPIILVDANRRIRRFTPMARTSLNLIPADVGRPIADLNLQVGVAHIDRLIAEVIGTGAPRVVETGAAGGRWYSLWIRPYRTGDEKVAGAVVVLFDLESLQSALAPGSRHVGTDPDDDPVTALGVLSAEFGTLQRGFEEYFELHLALAERHAVVTEPEEAIRGLLGAICRWSHWNLAELWLVAPEEDYIQQVGHWQPLGRRSAFVGQGAELRLRRGEGLPGQVWASGRPLWLADLRPVLTPRRREAAASEGLTSGFAFPIETRERVTGVVLLAGFERREPVEELGRRLARLGHLVGLLVERTRAERRLLELHERYRRLFEDDLSGVFVAGLDGRVVFYNPAFARLMGLAEHDGAPVEVSILGDDAELADVVATLRERRRIEQRERTLTGAAGRPLTVLETLVGIFDEAGRLAQIQGYLLDITSRKETERALGEVSGRLMHLQDEERRRIARDLHDVTAQKLSALAMALSMLDRSDRLSPGEREELARSQGLADQCALEMRTLSYLLHPPLLDEAGLGPALRVFADGLNTRSELSVTLDLPDVLDRLPADIETAVFRFVQEALRNVHLHSGAREAHVRIALDQPELVVSVSDRGRGMPADVQRALAVGLGTGVGLRSLRERVRQLGGTMAIVSSPAGTEVRAIIPVGEVQR